MPAHRLRRMTERSPLDAREGAPCQWAVPGEEAFPAVKAFYDDVIDGLAGKKYSAGWKKGIYPSGTMLREALGRHWFILRCRDQRILGAMVMNGIANEGYAGTDWAVRAAPSEVCFIHMLCVGPSFLGRGIGDALVEEALRRATADHMKAVRLDVLAGNEAALRLYERHGFQYRRTASMYYDDTGWTDYLLYEKVLE